MGKPGRLEWLKCGRLAESTPGLLDTCQRVNRKRARGHSSKAAFTLVFTSPRPWDLLKVLAVGLVLGLHHSSFSHCNS